MKYSEIISVKSSFSRSTNILYDSNCESYILSTSSIESLRRIFITNLSNSIAITGPFGSGKSSLLLFLAELLSKSKKYHECIDKLKDKDLEIYTQYERLVGDTNKGFLCIKLIGEHLSFKNIFFTAIQDSQELKKTTQYIEKNPEASFLSILKQLDKEVSKLGYTGVLIIIDELGKIIEYASDKYLDSDIHALQDLAEFVNKKTNYRLVTALHKSFRDYVHNTTQLSFTEWDKIQGRFENIVFQDDFYELMHIFEEAITVSSNELFEKVENQITHVFESYKKHVTDKNIPLKKETFKKLAPLHPFATLALFHIFSKHFQNQRSVFSFLAAQEPYSFQNFIHHYDIGEKIYTLPILFDYINYLSNAYNVNMIDKESWKLANEYLDSANILTSAQQQIIKSVALVSAFKLEHLIQLDEVGITLALPGEENVAEECKELEKKGLLLRKLKSFALIEEVSVDINAELNSILRSQVHIDYIKEINKIIANEDILAKRFYINTGTAKFFSKSYIGANIDTSDDARFNVFYLSSDIPKTEIINSSSKNKFCIFIPLSLTSKAHEIVDQLFAIETMLCRKDIQYNRTVRNVLQNMYVACQNEIGKILDFKEVLYFAGHSVPFSSEQLQSTISLILEETYSQMPIIINDLVNPLNPNIAVFPAIKKLFEHMLNHEREKDLAIQKTPPEKAIFLSVLKNAGLHIHNEAEQKWEFAFPKERNFAPIWKELTKKISSGKTIEISLLMKMIQSEPYGLNDDAAKFVLFVFLIIHEKNIHFFRERTYQFDFDIDQVMDIWKNTRYYTLRWFTLTDDEEKVFSKYVQLFDQYFDTQYTKQNIKYVFYQLYSKLKALPPYCTHTKKISESAVQLRSCILASKEPHEVFFRNIPRSIGYDKLTVSNADKFIEDFKQAFNEIVFSYKELVMELEQHVAEAFDLDSKHYPFSNELESLLEKYLSKHDASKIHDLYRVCTTANDLVSFLNGISFALIQKKIDDAFDGDIEKLKSVINTSATELLSKIDIIDIIKQRPVDVKKLKISTMDGESKLIMTVNNEKLPELSTIANGMSTNIPSNLSKEEKLYLITLMAEEIVKGANE